MMWPTPLEQRRARQERDLHLKLLAAIQKPKSRRFTSTLNSPFFIWLLSAILLTSAGAYFTNYTQCIADADRLSERYTRISREVLAREQAFADGVARATTIDEVLRTAKSYPSMYSDLASRSLVDLQSELLAISRKISAGPGFEH